MTETELKEHLHELYRVTVFKLRLCAVFVFAFVAGAIYTGKPIFLLGAVVFVVTVLITLECHNEMEKDLLWLY